MSNKPHKTSNDTPTNLDKPAVTSENATVQTSSDRWNPNVPFHGTQEEWWEHFHKIEQGTFYPVEETFQRISQWLDNYNRQ